MKQFSCGDVVPGCRRTFLASDDDAILTAVAPHAHDDHAVVEIPDALVAQVRRHTMAA
jgi:predicted small metal-binding protein